MLTTTLVQMACGNIAIFLSRASVALFFLLVLVFGLGWQPSPGSHYRGLSFAVWFAYSTVTMARVTLSTV
jgi:hypothetical protein